MLLLLGCDDADSEPDSGAVADAGADAGSDPDNPLPDAEVTELDYHVPVGTPVMLDGTASADPDGEPLTYRWEVIGPEDFVLSDPTSATPTFTPNERGTFAIRLIVNDGNRDSESGSRDTSTVNAYSMVPLTGVVEVAAGDTHTLALRSDGSVDAWGLNLWGATGRGAGVADGIAQIAADGRRSAALTSGGAILIWGMIHRELATGECSGAPCAREPVEMPALTDVVAITAQPSALTADGTLWEWQGSSTSAAWAERMTDIQAIGGTLAVRNDGTVWDIYADLQIEPLTGIAAVSSANASRCALAEDGTVWTIDPSVNHVAGLTDVIEVVARGAGVCLALKSDGTVWEAQGSSTAQVAGVTDVVSISGDGHVVFAKSDGTVWGWGANTAGQLGNGDSGPTAIVPQSSPVQVVF